MTTTTRLDEIIQRQRHGRSLDLLFAMFIAMLLRSCRSRVSDGLPPTASHAPTLTEAAASTPAPAPACPTIDVC